MLMSMACGTESVQGVDQVSAVTGFVGIEINERVTRCLQQWAC